MPAPSSALFPMFRSQLQTSIATEVFLHDEGITAAELVRTLNADQKNVSAAVKGLVEAGILRSTPVGRSRVLTADDGAPFYEPLRQLLTIVQGPPTVIGRALAECPGVRGAYIFGSWAARAAGEPGPPPRDVDVLVLSDEKMARSDRRVVFESLEQASETLRRPVNPVFATVDQWSTSEDAFLAEVREGHSVPAVPLPEEVAKS